MIFFTYARTVRVCTVFTIKLCHDFTIHANLVKSIA